MHETTTIDDTFHQERQADSLGSFPTIESTLAESEVTSTQEETEEETQRRNAAKPQPNMEGRGKDFRQKDLETER